ncbi:FtsQ-type POTRA domain-containing protein, partial [Wenyingzhuangia sp. 1_MG-2023]|nr:FtsQ-type POTRA domain-containing protein [Wenyingzhuangia sp. 1_MG-2023]
REPITRRLHIPVQVWIGLVIALLFVGAGVVVRQAYHTWPVQAVVVVGRLNVLNAEDIARQLLWVRDKSFFTLDVNQVQQQVAAIPLVSRVAVRKHWPDSVELLLYEELPVALWNDEQLLTATGRLSAI